MVERRTRHRPSLRQGMSFARPSDCDLGAVNCRPGEAGNKGMP